MCVLSIKVPIRKKSGNLFNDPFKCISAENITLLSVSSDDFLYALLEVPEQQIWSYSSNVKKELYSQARAEGVKI